MDVRGVQDIPIVQNTPIVQDLQTTGIIVPWIHRIPSIAFEQHPHTISLAVGILIRIIPVLKLCKRLGGAVFGLLSIRLSSVQSDGIPTIHFI